MHSVDVTIPEELVELLKQSRLGERPVSEMVRTALAIHLFQESLISAGKAASIAGQPRATFELLLGEMGIPVLRADVSDYRQDLESLKRARQD